MAGSLAAMEKPPLTSKGADADSAEEADMDPRVRAASAIREAIDSQDDESLADALCALIDLHMSKADSAASGGMAAMGEGKPKLVVSIGHAAK